MARNKHIPTVTTEPISAANWLAALELSVHPDQHEFVPTVALSLAKAYIRPNGFCYDPFGIYRTRLIGRDLVGFYSLIHLPNEFSFCYLGGFFIDSAFQGQGYGTAALRHLLTAIQCTHPQCTEILLSVHPQNQRAIALYTKHGFTKTGHWLDGEEEMRLCLGK